LCARAITRRRALGRNQTPVVRNCCRSRMFSYEDCVAFAEWRSKRDGVTYRLPIEEEWEYAARNATKIISIRGATPGRPTRGYSGIRRRGDAAGGTYAQGIDRWGVEDLVGKRLGRTSSKGLALQRYPGQLPGHTRIDHNSRGLLREFDQERTAVSGTLRTWYCAEITGIRCSASVWLSSAS